jgi:hypothetical protein
MTVADKPASDTKKAPPLAVASPMSTAPQQVKVEKPKVDEAPVAKRAKPSGAPAMVDALKDEQVRAEAVAPARDPRVDEKRKQLQQEGKQLKQFAEKQKQTDTSAVCPVPVQMWEGCGQS